MPVKVSYCEYCAADLVAKPLENVKERSRNQVKVLGGTKYGVFMQALYKLISAWLSGSLGSGAPTEPDEIELIKRVNESNKVRCEEEVDARKVNDVYDDLVRIKVPGHLRTVTSHRRWIRGTLRFLKSVGAEISDKMNKLVTIHDLSKYSHKEVLGYAIMFGDGSIDFRQLQTEEETFEWENSLYNHYAHNPHHPEYFYPAQENGTRRRDRSIMELDSLNGKDYVLESIVDMLASRGERYLSDDAVLSVEKWFDIPDRFMGRYCADDAAYVKRTLSGWLTLCQENLSVPGNAEKLRGIIDDRTVVY